MIRRATWCSTAVIGLAMVWDAPAGAAAEPSSSSKIEPATAMMAEEDGAIANDTIDPTDAAPAPEKEVEVIRERFPNGAVKIERQVAQDAQENYVNHGSWKMFDQHGNVVAQGEYQMGQRVGAWTRWYRNASEAKLFSNSPYQQYTAPFISQATFKDGQLDGSWTIYDGKQKKISQWHFAGGRRHGLSTWWNANGKKMREIQYRDGNIDGQLLEWDLEGKQVTQDIFQAGRKLAPKIERHPDGTKKSEATYLFAKQVVQTPDDWWDCKLQTFSKSGPDEKNGPWVSWHTNGKHEFEGTYEHDVQVGLFTWWHSNGQKALEGRFVDGKQDGRWIWWHSNGQKAIRGDYAHGTPAGRWTWWKEDGKIAEVADLSNSDGVVVESPSTVEPNKLPQAKKSQQPKPIKR